jgi:glycine hydroxymethyltransferase
MKEPEMKLIGEWISKILDNPKQGNIRKKIREKVKELCERFPIYVNSS